MYQFIIVDDEEIIRQGLAKSFDWFSMGFELVGQFEDGKDAVGFLDQHPVDVVLTDVRMYEMSGIELAGYIFENHPQTKVVILSGYREFEYARQAMSYGVCDYILKPVSREELYQVFLRLRELLDKSEEKMRTTLPFDHYGDKSYEEILACGAKLVAAVMAGNTTEVYRLHEEWFLLLENAPLELLFFVISNVIEEIYLRFSQMGISLDEELQKDKVFSQLADISIADLFSVTGQTLVRFCHFLSEKKEGSEESMIVRAKQYIENHLSENFSIDDVAKSVFLSSSYFSREFKSHTGRNVIDYIIDQRMKKAMELLKEGKYSANEISAMVGYGDTKYFYRSFKKHTGFTVRQYQKMIL